MTVAGDRLVAVRLGEHGRLGPDVDVVGVLLGDVDEDPDDVGAVDHVDRRGMPPGERSGERYMAVGSPVVGRTKSKVLALRATITPSKGAVSVR